jgi:hypothetical protein
MKDSLPTPSSCPSEFALERWRFGELAASVQEAELVAHVAACSKCHVRQSELAQTKQPGLETETIWSTANGRRPRKPSWRPRAWQGVALATSAVAALLVIYRRPAPDTLAKGAWELGIIAQSHDGKVMRIDPGAALSPGDRLRFEVATSWGKADIALVMLDSAGKVSQLAPTGNRSLSIAGGKRVLLDDAVQLDGVLGPERIVLVACTRALDVSGVVASAEHALAAAGGDPRRVPSLGTGCHEESFWISKVSP